MAGSQRFPLDTPASVFNSCSSTHYPKQKLCSCLNRDLRCLQFPRKTWVFNLSLEMARVGVGDASSKQFCLHLSARMTLYLSQIPGITSTGPSHLTQSLGK